MNRADRAKQFLPFDALKGLQEELRAREEKRSRVEKIALSETQEQEISETLARVERGDKVEVTFFNRGHYFVIEDIVRDVNAVHNCLIFSQGKIFFSDIYKIDIATE